MPVTINGSGTISGVPGAILQVASSTKTDTFSMSSSTFTDVTGLTVSITPRLSTSKILVMATVVASQQVGTNNGFLRLARSATGIFIADAASSRRQVSMPVNASNADYPDNYSLIFLDSPSSTSSLTYSVQISTNGASSVYVNRSLNDPDTTSNGRYASSITVMEVAA